MSIIQWILDKWPLVWRKKYKQQYWISVKQGIRIAVLEADKASYKSEIRSLKEHNLKLIQSNIDISHQRDVLLLSRNLNGLVLVGSWSPVFDYITNESADGRLQIKLQTLHCSVALSGHDVPREEK